eukprot:166542-Chlamydomonas_euryale.AAC.2
MVKCNVPLRTPTRGPGEPQSQVLIENVVEHVAALTGLPPHAVREANMLRPPCGGVGSTALGKAVPDRLYTMPRIWDELKASCGLQAKLADVAAFNSANRWRKRGVSMVPSRYSLQVGKRQATVIIYTDGTIVVAHPGVETGQGLLTKARQTPRALRRVGWHVERVCAAGWDGMWNGFVWQKDLDAEADKGLSMLLLFPTPWGGRRYEATAPPGQIATSMLRSNCS